MTVTGSDADSAMGYYKDMYFGVLDKIIQEIRDRFQENGMETLIALNKIPGSTTHTEADLAFDSRHFGFPKEETSVELSLCNATPSKEIGFDQRLALFKASDVGDSKHR